LVILFYLFFLIKGLTEQHKPSQQIINFRWPSKLLKPCELPQHSYTISHTTESTSTQLWAYYMQ